jgi:hypothetical protein
MVKAEKKLGFSEKSLLALQSSFSSFPGIPNFRTLTLTLVFAIIRTEDRGRQTALEDRIRARMFRARGSCVSCP